MLKSIAAALVAVTFVMGAAGAEDAKPLTTDEATRFVETLEPVQVLGETMREDGKAEALGVEIKPKMGEVFKPYSSAVAAMETKYPAEHGKLAKVVGEHGFKTTGSWASVGDRLMIAYLAERMERDNPDAMAQMAAMDPSMMSMAPPEMRAQLEPMMAMMSAVKNAPKADRAALRPVMPQLDAFMESAGQQ